MPYFGVSAKTFGFGATAKDTFSGDDSTVAFTLSQTSAANEVEVFVGNVQQEPTIAYSISGSTLTFTEAPPTGTNNIYVLHRGRTRDTILPPADLGDKNYAMSGALSVTGNVTTTGNLKINDGANIGSASDADAISISSTGVTTFSQRDIHSGGITIADGGEIGSASATGAITITSGGDIGINSSTINSGTLNSGNRFLEVAGGSTGAGTLVLSRATNTDDDIMGDLRFVNANNADDDAVDADGKTVVQIVARVESTDSNAGDDCGGHLIIANKTEANAQVDRMKFHSASNGNIVMCSGNIDNVTPAQSSIQGGLSINDTGAVELSCNGQPLMVNRHTDGRIIDIMSNGTREGSIDISGTTVAYNTFTGTHWSRLSDNSKPTILVGTVMESIDAMMDWYQAQYEVSNEVISAGGKVETKTYTQHLEIDLPDGKSAGDTVTITHWDGKDYTATVVKESDQKHVQCKVSDASESTSVYGVFNGWEKSNWDDNDKQQPYFKGSYSDPAAGVNDMLIAAVGTHVVRINKDVTVAKGDLLVSNGDGTAKKQSDDIIRSKTIGKVLANVKQETYSDGSYIVPCALYCG